MSLFCSGLLPAALYSTSVLRVCTSLTIVNNTLLIILQIYRTMTLHNIRIEGCNYADMYM